MITLVVKFLKITTKLSVSEVCTTLSVACVVHAPRRAFFANWGGYLVLSSIQIIHPIPLGDTLINHHRYTTGCQIIA